MKQRYRIILLSLLILVATPSLGYLFARNTVYGFSQRNLAWAGVAHQTSRQAQIVPTFTPTPSTRKRLPDAVYFLNMAGQITRLEADGVQITPITHEATTVLDFDVAPDGEHLAYITGNSLIESNANGEQRIVKVQGAVVDLKDAKQRITQALNAVLYTPDGQQITFGRNGVNWIASGNNREDAQLLFANDPFPDPQKPETIHKEGSRFVSPAAWSPDGKRLLFSYYYHNSDDFGFGVFDLTTRLATQAHCPRACTWSQDSQALFFTENVYGAEIGPRLSLSRSDATTGERTVLVQGAPTGTPSIANPYRFFQGVYQASDGTLLTFGEVWSETPSRERLVHHYTLQRVSVDGAQITPLRTDTYKLEGETLWAMNGSGALINDVRNKNVSPHQGPLLWLPSDGSAALTLPAVGYHMRWRTRPPVSTQVTMPAATAAPAPLTQVTTLDLLNVRSGPGVQYAVVSQLAQGTTVHVQGKSTDGAWWLLQGQVNGQQAWISADPSLTSNHQQGAAPLTVLSPLLIATPTPAVSSVATRPKVTEVPGFSFTFSPDDHWLAVIDKQHLQLFDTTTWQLRWQVANQTFVHLAFNATGDQLATIGQDILSSEQYTLRWWNVADGRLITQFDLAKSVSKFVFSADGQWLAMSSSTGKIVVVHANTGEQIAELQNPWPVRNLAISPTGPWVAVTGSDGQGKAEVTVWDMFSHEQRSQLQIEHPRHYGGIFFSPDARWLAAVLSDQEESPIFVWQTKTWPQVARLKLTDDFLVTNVVFSQDSRRLAGIAGNQVCLWETGSWRSLGKLTQTGTIVNLVFSPDGKRLLTSFEEDSANAPAKEAQLWDVESNTLVARMIHKAPVGSIAFSHQGRWIATTNFDGVVTIWENGS